MVDIPIWTGSSSFTTGSTPFGTFDNDADFQSEIDKFADWCAKRLGYPIVDVELQAENFLARYTPDTQGHLSLHHDNSHITALVNLSEKDIDYTGGGTWFWRQKYLSRSPQGYISVHPGNITHKHGARPVLSGKRYIIVSFMKNKEF